MAAVVEVNSNLEFPQKQRGLDNSKADGPSMSQAQYRISTGDAVYPPVNLPQIPPPISYSLPKSSIYHEPPGSNSKSLDSIDLEAQSDTVYRIRRDAHLNPNEPDQNPPENQGKFALRLRGGCCCCDCLYDLLRCLLCCCIFEAICDFCC